MHFLRAFRGAGASRALSLNRATRAFATSRNLNSPLALSCRASEACTRPSEAAQTNRVLKPAVRFNATMPDASYKNIIVARSETGRVATIQLNRPKALNALCNELFDELNAAITQLEEDSKVGAIVLTGSDRAFAAGADIKEMASRGFVENLRTDFLGHWTRVANTRKPVIAAVRGFALGGGCELAMMCDVIYAGESARFGQPEIKLGVIPGAGGTQRLTHAVGKAKAMELVLGGDMWTAQEAERAGLVARVFKDSDVVAEATKFAEKVAAHSQVTAQLCKEMVNAAFNMPLAEGLRVERRMFHAAFATRDQKEGMAAFMEKRKANFTNEVKEKLSEMQQELAPSATSSPAVVFDELGRLRLLNDKVADASETMQTKCIEFADASRNLLKLVERVTAESDRCAAMLQAARHRAVTARSGVEREPARRRSELNQISYAIREQQLVLERLTAEYESLLRIEHDQEAFLASLRAR